MDAVSLDNSQYTHDNTNTFMVPNPNMIVQKEDNVFGPGGDGPIPSNTENEVSDTRSFVMNEVQILLQEVDEKRKADEKILSQFRNTMSGMLEQTFQQIEERIQRTNEETNKQMKLKLDFLKESLDRVISLEEELGNFKNAVGVLYQDIQHK